MYLYSPPDFLSFESIMSLTERRGRNVNSQWKKISEVNRQTHGNSCIFYFYFYTSSRFHKNNCTFQTGFAYMLTVHQIYPKTVLNFFFSFSFLTPYATFVNTKSLSGSCEIYKFSCYCRQYANKTPHIKWCISIFVSIIIPNVNISWQNV